jgi:hypothetical protein
VLVSLHVKDRDLAEALPDFTPEAGAVQSGRRGNRNGGNRDGDLAIRFRSNAGCQRVEEAPPERVAGRRHMRPAPERFGNHEEAAKGPGSQGRAGWWHFDRRPTRYARKAISEKEAHGEFESEHPGYYGAQDTFSVGTMKGGGRIYQQTFVDTYSKLAFAQLYDHQTPITAADLE